MKLNLGCGNKRKEGFWGLDLHPCDALDLRCDITRPLPIRDDSVEAVHLDNVIEHVVDIPALMKEIVRVSRDGALVTLITPHFSSLDSWQDPTHVHHLAYSSFEHFELPEVGHYIGGGLKIEHRRLSFGSGLMALMARLLFKLSPQAYERKFCFVFRASALRVTLRVAK